MDETKDSDNVVVFVCDGCGRELIIPREGVFRAPEPPVARIAECKSELVGQVMTSGAYQPPDVREQILSELEALMTKYKVDQLNISWKKF